VVALYVGIQAVESNVITPFTILDDPNPARPHPAAAAGNLLAGALPILATLIIAAVGWCCEDAVMKDVLGDGALRNSGCSPPYSSITESVGDKG